MIDTHGMIHSTCWLLTDYLRAALNNPSEEWVWHYTFSDIDADEMIHQAISHKNNHQWVITRKIYPDYQDTIELALRVSIDDLSTQISVKDKLFDMSDLFYQHVYGLMQQCLPHADMLPPVGKESDEEGLSGEYNAV